MAEAARRNEVCLVSVLVPAPLDKDAVAAGGEEFPAALQLWTPAQPLGRDWAAAGTGTDTIASLCPGAWRSWRRADGVVFGLKAYRCSPSQLATLNDILNRLRQTMPAQWRQILAALAGAADVVVLDGEKRHVRYWVQDPDRVRRSHVSLIGMTRTGMMRTPSCALAGDLVNFGYR